MTTSETKKLLDEVLADIAKLEAELGQLRQVRTYLQGKTSAGEGPVPSTASSSNGRKLTQSEAAEKVLLETGKAMGTNALVAEIVRRGYYQERSDRKQLVNSVFSALRRAPDRFKKVGRGLWDLTERNRG